MTLPPLTVVCFKWRQKYRSSFEAAYVNTLHTMVRRHYTGDVRFICVTDEPRGIECETYPLWSDCDGMVNASGAHLPSCYRRLKLFHSTTTRSMGIPDGSRVVWIDLDVVITGYLAPLFDRDAEFCGWWKTNTLGTPSYNGSVLMFRSGAVDYLWDEFDPATTPQKVLAAGYSGSDQSWISYRMGSRFDKWGAADGVLSWKHDTDRSDTLPDGARIVVFHGKEKCWLPATQKRSPWIADHWYSEPVAPLDDGKRGRTALIVGGAWCVDDDVQAALALFEPDIVLAVNDIAAHLPRVDHHVSMHPEHMDRWRIARAQNGYSPVGRVWTAVHKQASEAYRRVVNPGGGSAGLATEVALHLGAEKIVLAGCPLTPEPHFFDQTNWKMREVEHYRRSWSRNKKHWGARVRSMSGWTAQTYGAPTAGWLNDIPEEAAA